MTNQNNPQSNNPQQQKFGQSNTSTNQSGIANKDAAKKTSDQSQQLNRDNKMKDTKRAS